MKATIVSNSMEITLECTPCWTHIIDQFGLIRQSINFLFYMGKQYMLVKHMKYDGLMALVCLIKHFSNS